MKLQHPPIPKPEQMIGSASVTPGRGMDGECAGWQQGSACTLTEVTQEGERADRRDDECRSRCVALTHLRDADGSDGETHQE